MASILEGKLMLTFPADWAEVKYDATDWYRQHFTHCKALDVLAVSEQALHCWIEIKDCEGYEDANLSRLSDAEPAELKTTRTHIQTQGLHKIIKVKRAKPYLIDEIIEKLHDTIGCMTIARQTGVADLTPFAAWSAGGQQLIFILLLTWESEEFKRIAIRLSQKLEQALSPYGINGIVINPFLTPEKLPFEVRRLAE